MKCWSCRFLCVAAFLACSRLEAEIISWFSDAHKTNLDAAGASMDAGFQFELGVFSDSFVPTSLNVSQWSSHWVVADSTTYNAATHRFSGQFMVRDNTGPFVLGTQAWILGYRITPTGTDRILFRNTGWTWPSPNPLDPLATEWNATAADVVVMGNVNSSGSPFLMKSVVQQTFAQWQTEHLTGEPLNGPGDDPDKDGSSNLLEFVFGTPPKSAGAPTATPVTLAGGHVQITIPRRIDRLALFTVEVSENLSNWQSGPSFTETIDDGPSALIVRDLTLFDPAHPQRFMRLKAEPAAP
jgi:hypothetical protein